MLRGDAAGTHSIYNLIFGIAGEKARWVRVDDPNTPQAVIAARRMMYLYAANNHAAARLLAELPKRWRLEFAATPKRLVPVIRQALKLRRRKLHWVAPCYLYVLGPGRQRAGRRATRDQAGLVIYRKHRVGTLLRKDAKLVARYWPHGHSVKYVERRIRSGPTCAIRRQGRLVAWALTHDDGAMGILHVLDEYRGQGFARAITTSLALRCRKAGIAPFLYIVKRNRASISLTESMGFSRVGEYCWLGE